jgi:hypothetical protein
MNLKDLLPFGLMLVIAIIAISIGAEVVTNVDVACGTGGTWNESAGWCYNSSGDYNAAVQSYQSNATHSGLQGIGEFGSWMPTIALVVVASLVIGLLVYSFAGQQ